MTKKRDRNYRREYDQYHGKPEQIANRAARNKARATLAKEGLVRKGDGKEVDHKKSINDGGSKTARSNLQVLPRSANRKKGG